MRSATRAQPDPISFPAKAFSVVPSVTGGDSRVPALCAEYKVSSRVRIWTCRRNASAACKGVRETSAELGVLKSGCFLDDDIFFIRRTGAADSSW